MQLTYSPPTTLSLLLNQHGPAVRWLLKFALASGGWAYEKTQPEFGLGYQTTAAAIAALCRFLRCAKSLARDGAAFAQLEISSAIQSAYVALAAQANQGTWNGASDGTPDSREVADSAFAIHLLVRASLEDELQSYVGEEGPKASRILGNLVSIARPDGWPARVNDRISSLSATVCSLGLIATSPYEDVLSRAEERQAAEARLLEAWHTLQVEDVFIMWDWAALLSFASKRAGPINEQKRNSLQSTTQTLRRAWLQNSLDTRSLRKLPNPIRAPITFALTEGGRHKARSTAMAVLRKATLEVNREFVILIFVSLILAVLSFFALRL
ncbi:MAG: hypothetical protein ISP45_04145 [Reyranella sp.]|nr:hypothetical protein [Reyranella sp.]